jgi:cellulose synthase/poly-beta-1,6-N-acetylglucosamine synthase-like glycosyltransferase/peptidoglycan/xylan/chitin deacetylase (PgdA/CDA1 family)/spore germination protein YaaH
MKQGSPVFFDPSRRRWPIIKRITFFSGLLLALTIAVFLVNIFSSPKFDAALSSGNVLKIRKGFGLGWSPLKIGFFAYWDNNCFSSLKAHLSELDAVIGDWLSLSSADGSLSTPNVADQKVVMDYINSHKPDTKIIAMINNAGSEWDSVMLSEMLARPEARRNAIEKLLEYSKANHLAGICVDFESIPHDSLPDYYSFIGELSAAFHEANMLVLVSVPADNADLDYKSVSALSDYVIVMAYDEHWSESPPGPIADMDWFSSVLRKRQGDVPAKKMILALGSYAYDWEVDGSSGAHPLSAGDPASGRHADGSMNEVESLPPKAGSGFLPAKSRTFKDVISTAIWSKGDITMDPASLNPVLEYADASNKKHQVWMLDAITFFNEMARARPLEPYGIALWRLGAEDPAVWKVFRADKFDGGTARKLASIDYDYGFDFLGDGEILRIVQNPTSGKREVDFNDDKGLIVSEKYIVYPLPCVISLSGSVKNEIALTFDDGPDPRYTPFILDELKKAHVPATFFVIGANAMKNPDIVQKEFTEGHEIGNHTFTHPDTSRISGVRLRGELEATELILEKIIGRGTHFFRAPYNTDSEPMTGSELETVELINNLGYEVIGMKIDTDDWERPGAEAIVRNAEEGQVTEGGNIVLMHDGGGERSQTVQALPGIIKAFRDKGFRFVTVSQLIGKTRDEIMPAAPQQSGLFEWGRYLGFDVLGLGRATLALLFLTGIILGLARLLFVTVVALGERMRKKDPYGGQKAEEFSVSVVIPAYNEEKVIRKTIDSVLMARHPKNFEILVIDDGSTDNTFKIIKETYGREPQVKAFSMPNGGKHSALNYGIHRAAGEIIVTFDADTIVTRDAIVKLARRFSDPSVGAVAGNAKVGNRINILTRWQALEYVTSQNMDRRALDMLNGITVIPGSIGAWRRDVLKEAGGFSGDTLAEDSDLTITIIKLGYRVCYEEDAIASTEAPADIKGFVRQRFRWMFGTFQAAWKHKDALFRPKYGFLGCFSLPNIFLFQVFFPVISPVMDVVMLLAVLSAGIDRWQHPASFSPDSLIKILIFYFMFLMSDFLAAAIAFLLERKEDKRLLILLVPQRFFYRQLIYYVAIKSIVASLRGGLVGWSKVKRMGTVETHAERSETIETAMEQSEAVEAEMEEQMETVETDKAYSKLM